MKKLFFSLLVALLLLCLVACDTGTPPTADGDTGALPDGGETPDEGEAPDDGETPDGNETPGGGKPTVDMSGVDFPDATLSYSGYPQSIRITGTLPEGVTVSYSGNSRTEPGSYTVTASFTVPEGYAPVASMRAIMRIQEPAVKDGGMVFVDAGKTHLYRLDDGFSRAVLRVPDSAARIAEGAMASAEDLFGVYIPSSVRYIGPHAVGFVKKGGSYEKIDGFVVYGEAGSVAETWCETYGISFDSVHLPRTYQSPTELYDPASTDKDQLARRHLAELMTLHGIDIEGYGELFDLQIERAAEAVASMTASTEKAKVEAAIGKLLRLSPNVTVTVSYVDESGNSIVPTRRITVPIGEDYSILSPSVTGYYTRDLYLTGMASADLSVTVRYRKIPKNADEARIEELLADIVCWGDSLTAGAGCSDTAVAKEHSIDLTGLGSTASGLGYVQVLNNLIRSRVYNRITVTNCGVGGETSAVIAARAGAASYQLYIDRTVTVSSYATDIAIAQNASSGRLGILRQGGGNSINPVTLVGTDASGNPVTVTGRIEISLANGAPADTNIKTCDYSLLKYTFYRTDDGDEIVTLEKGTKIITSGSYLYDGNLCVIFIGQNGGYANPAELIKQQEEILAACDNPENYIIISTHGGTSASRKAVNDALTAHFGDRYINMGTVLSSESAYKIAGFRDEVIKENEAKIASGTVSSLFLNDSIHPNAVGYAVIGNVIFERMATLGYFDALYDYYDSLQ